MKPDDPRYNDEGLGRHGLAGTTGVALGAGFLGTMAGGQWRTVQELALRVARREPWSRWWPTAMYRRHLIPGALAGGAAATIAALYWGGTPGIKGAVAGGAIGEAASVGAGAWAASAMAAGRFPWATRMAGRFGSWLERSAAKHEVLGRTIMDLTEQHSIQDAAKVFSTEAVRHGIAEIADWGTTGAFVGAGYGVGRMVERGRNRGARPVVMQDPAPPRPPKPESSPPLINLRATSTEAPLNDGRMEELLTRLHNSGYAF